MITGGNTVSFRQGGTLHIVPGFKARPGYDLASGTGTVNALLFVPELAAAAAGHRPDRRAAALAPRMPTRFRGALPGSR